MEVRFMYPEIITLLSEKDKLLGVIARLKEQDGERIVDINLNNLSATHLAYSLMKDRDVGPEIFKFVSKCLETMKGGIEKVVIYDIDPDGFFLANVFIKDDRENKTYRLKLHVTDSLSLAVVSECPIFIDTLVLKKMSPPKENKIDEETNKFFDKLNPNKPKD